MVLDHVLGDQQVALARHHRQMPRIDLRVARDVDALDIDLGRDLPEHAGLPRAHQVRGRPSMLTIATSSALVATSSNSSAASSGCAGLEHGEAIGRELGAHDVVQLDRELMRRIEQRVAAGLEHPLEPAVARQEGALAILDRDAQREQVPVHNTSPSLAPRGRRGDRGVVFEDWVPDAHFPGGRRAEA